MSDQTGLGADRLKHLELIQAVVTRLANTSFLIKGWTLTIAAAFFGILVNKINWGFAVTGLIPIVAFWFLDGLFLRNEQLFRRLYDDARKADSTVESMSMDTRPYMQQNKTTWASATFSTTLFLFYGALVFVNVALVVVAVLRLR
ncbi:hypothetical protein [Frankia sp. Cj3]|uniref:hypothetical protein n=1 Tax=Frankia sp. Cj3 TaxID=2880976 RepID=UPI001EF74D67|nr:hypothetical protein [Frankia sp. Cj3]